MKLQQKVRGVPIPVPRSFRPNWRPHFSLHLWA